MSAAPRPAFYRRMAIALSLFAIVGFSQTYYLRFPTDLPPLDTVVHLHGIAFTTWLLVFIVQTRDAAAILHRGHHEPGPVRGFPGARHRIPAARRISQAFHGGVSWCWP